MHIDAVKILNCRRMQKVYFRPNEIIHGAQFISFYFNWAQLIKHTKPKTKYMCLPKWFWSKNAQNQNQDHLKNDLKSKSTYRQNDIKSFPTLDINNN